MTKPQLSLPVRILIIALSVGVLAVGLFVLAGRWNWWEGWAFIVLLTLGSTVQSLIVARASPGLLDRRAQFGAGTQGWDVAMLSLFGLAYLAVIIVGVLDSGRFGWVPLPGWLWPIGALTYLAGMALLTWSMAVNRFFEKTVRLQTDQGHRVVSAGPYAYVRHPGYGATLLSYCVAPPLLLGSGWAIIPAEFCAFILILRTVLEDRFLRSELNGYEDYARDVPKRLLPGVW